MYIHIGDNITIPADQLILVINNDTAISSLIANNAFARSTIVYNGQEMEIIYSSPVSTTTILKRSKVLKS